MFDTRARIWTIFLWTIASNVGLFIGPITSTIIIESLHWYPLPFIPSQPC